MRLCNQREPLLREQRKIVNEHPAEGARRLIIAGVNDDEWLRAVLEHHETPDGKGYPRKVGNPGEMAQLLQTADVFTAKVSPRAHRRPMMASQATKEVFMKFSYEGKNPFPKLLVSEIGIYPPGAILRLANGEVGVVYKRGPNPKTPIVATLLNATGMPVLKPVIRTTGSEPAYAIAGVMAHDSSMVGLNFEQIWGSKDATR
jgi:HD-GYP domain-containing protein (c-di-GMP phosphodiesterase class II)